MAAMLTFPSHGSQHTSLRTVANDYYTITTYPVSQLYLNLKKNVVFGKKPTSFLPQDNSLWQIQHHSQLSVCNLMYIDNEYFSHRVFLNFSL